MRRFALLIALAAFVATVALLDAITRGSFVAHEGLPAAVDGTGPILVTTPTAAHRGAIGRGRIALLVSPGSSAIAREIAGALARTGLSATFALTAEMAIGDASLAGDLRKSGHDVAYAGVAAADATSLPEPLWRVAETLGLRMVESAAGERLALYAPVRLLRGAARGPPRDRAREGADRRRARPGLSRGARHLALRRVAPRKRLSGPRDHRDRRRVGRCDRQRRAPRRGG